MRAIILLLAATLCGCNNMSNIQTSSGADYLAHGPVSGGLHAAAGQPSTDLDEAVRQAALVEPTAHFPMKICVARQSGQGLGSPSDAELQRLTALSNKLGNGYGEFALLNPIVTEMASAGYTHPANETPVRRLVADIRLGAARQHCDTVFLYATSANVRRSVNPLTLLDITLVGMLVVPSHEVNATAQANGLLLDVRTGYPYAQLSGAAKSGTLTTAQSQGDAARTHADEAQLEAVDDMLRQVPDTLEGLRARLNANK